jgi:serine/threonine protein kinase
MECMRDTFNEGFTLGGRYQAIKLLNHGSFGMVYLAKDTITEQQVAIKCLVKSGSPAAASSEVSVDEFSQELGFHKTLGSHPNIVNLLDTFETECHSFLVLEFCPMGDLYEIIRVGRGPLETEHVREFMLQLVDAVEYMHSKGVYHRDIKPENIFLTQDGTLKLGDFGLATTEEWTEESGVGSDRYMAPEQYDALGGYEPRKADIWAIGICLLNVLFARNPFAVPVETDPLFADYVLDKESLFDIFPTMSYDTYEVLTHCLSIDPHKRSLANVRDAIERVVSWTIDDESLDDFCAEEREVVAASANREPLRTPSIQTPQVTNGGAFPWAKALYTIPAKRQPTIPEHPEPRYHEDMFRDKPDEYFKDSDYQYVQSYDSGLGESFSSIPKQKPFNLRFETVKAKNPTPACQPPVTAATTQAKSIPMAQKSPNVFGSSVDSGVSKSWSDWVDEDEEEEERERLEREKELKRRSWSYESDYGSADDGYDVEWIGGGWEDLSVV